MMMFHSFVPWIALVPSMCLFFLLAFCVSIIVKYCFKQLDQLTTYFAIYIVNILSAVNLIVANILMDMYPN
ncbi:hypothetical protein B296_00045922 [Ensete ventricosum]|uniref:Uncharacterized protein n=1 Tax=Ensete ventricosum TaxID=4639 RepID=A0A426YDI5_ENSVE|nr:hypothetical protein B296_00045922 [Ensete ventricosum]